MKKKRRENSCPEGYDGSTNLEQDGDAQVHKGFGEIDDHLACVIDRHRSHG